MHMLYEELLMKFSHNYNYYIADQLARKFTPTFLD